MMRMMRKGSRCRIKSYPGHAYTATLYHQGPTRQNPMYTGKGEGADILRQQDRLEVAKARTNDFFHPYG